VATWQGRLAQRLVPMVQAEHDRLRVQRPKVSGRPKKTVVTGYVTFDDSEHTKNSVWSADFAC